MAVKKLKNKITGMVFLLSSESSAYETAIKSGNFEEVKETKLETEGAATTEAPTEKTKINKPKKLGRKTK